MKSCLKKDNFHFINKIVKKPTLKIQGWVRAIKVAGLASFWRNSPIRRMRSNSWGSVYSNLSPTVMRHRALRMGRLNWLAMLIGWPVSWLSRLVNWRTSSTITSSMPDLKGEKKFKKIQLPCNKYLLILFVFIVVKGSMHRDSTPRYCMYCRHFAHSRTRDKKNILYTVI